MRKWKDTRHGQLYAELKEKGICVDCKEAQAVDGQIRCEACRDLNRKRVKDWAQYLKDWRKKNNVQK